MKMINVVFILVIRIFITIFLHRLLKDIKKSYDLRLDSFDLIRIFILIFFIMMDSTYFFSPSPEGSNKKSVKSFHRRGGGVCKK